MVQNWEQPSFCAFCLFIIRRYDPIHKDHSCCTGYSLCVSLVESRGALDFYDIWIYIDSPSLSRVRKAYQPTVFGRPEAHFRSSGETCWRCSDEKCFQLGRAAVPFELLMKRKMAHKERWLLLYVEGRSGRVVSPVLANLFLHWVFDAWMKRVSSPAVLPVCRRWHCPLSHGIGAHALKNALEERFKEAS